MVDVSVQGAELVVRLSGLDGVMTRWRPWQLRVPLSQVSSWKVVSSNNKILKARYAYAPRQAEVRCLHGGASYLEVHLSGNGIFKRLLLSPRDPQSVAGALLEAKTHIRGEPGS